MSKEEIIKVLCDLYIEGQNQDDVEKGMAALMATVAVILADEKQLQIGMTSVLETIEKMVKEKHRNT